LAIAHRVYTLKLPKVCVRLIVRRGEKHAWHQQVNGTNVYA